MRNLKTKKVRRSPGTTELLLWDIPPKVKRKFKKKCVAKKTTMRAAILGFMEEF